MESPTKLFLWITKFGLAAGFVGLGLLGLALMGMSIVLPSGFIERFGVFLLGFFGVFVAVAAGMTAINRPNTTH